MLSAGLILRWCVFLLQGVYACRTLLHSHLCPSGLQPGICLSISLFNVSDVLDRAPTSVPTAWTSQGEQVEWETKSLEKAQLSEIWRQVLQWCQTLAVPHILLDLWLSRGPVFIGICFQAPRALVTWPALKATHACMHVCAFICICVRLWSTTLRDRHFED